MLDLDGKKASAAEKATKKKKMKNNCIFWIMIESLRNLVTYYYLNHACFG